MQMSSAIPDRTAHAADRQPIAVIGMSCRFAGANSPSDLWDLLHNGLDATSDTPPDRYDVDTLYSPVPKAGKVLSRRAGYIADAYRFDAGFFGLADSEVAELDPQQRLLMTTAWEALEDAGIPPIALKGSRTGVYVGASYADFADRAARRGLNTIDVPALCNFRSQLPGRLSYFFDLRGPSICVDTACSSSLVAIHLACQSLRVGETTMALAAGANLKLVPDRDVLFSRARVVAPDGRCKFGDADADGAAFSDGVGIVVLKPLDRALDDGDRVRAVILGSAVSHDGATGDSLLAPSVEGHVEMLRWAYHDAGVAPSDVDFVEAHGNGTPTMDPVEFAGLDTVLSEGRPPGRPCFVGSIKTNIGHTESAAGVAGLIKAVLCLEHRQIVPSLHFATPNPDIAWDRMCLVVPTTVHPLPDRGKPTIAGVSGQGLSSVNTHLVVGGQFLPTSPSRPFAANDRSHLLALSARTPKALADLAGAYVRYLRPGGRGHQFDLRDICHSAAIRRQHHNERLAVAGSSHTMLVSRLEAFFAGRSADDVTTSGDEPDSMYRDRHDDSESEPTPQRQADRYVRGLAVRWNEILESGARYVPLPTYPWQSRDYRIDTPDVKLLPTPVTGGT